MTTATPIKTAPGIPSARPAMPGTGVGAGMPSIDITKLLKKYKWILSGAAIFGAILGVAAYLVLMRVYPIYKPVVLFNALPPTTSIDEVVTGNKDADEQERFIATQVALMKSDTVIQNVVIDPRLQSQTTEFAKMFIKNKQFQAKDATEWLYDHLKSSAVPKTDLMSLSLGWKNPQDTTNVLGLVREAYMNLIAQYARDQSGPQRTQLENQIRDLTEQIDAKQKARDAILKTSDVDSLEQRYTSANQSLFQAISTLSTVNTTIESTKSQLATYEAELNSPTGPTYSDELIQAVEATPMIQNIMQTITGLEAQKSAMQLRGIGPDHREMHNVDTLLESWNHRLDDERNRMLKKQFAAIVSGMRNTLASLQAQKTQLENERTELIKRLIDLNQVFVKVKDLDQEIDGLIALRAEQKSALNNLQSVGTLDTAKRVVVYQRERIPDKPVFPNILYMVPAGIVLVLGLTTGIIFLRELLDQRVKGPSDVTMIPRTRLLGIIPHAGEDSTVKKGNLARVFQTAADGAVAESYRKIRSPLIKHIHRAGYKTIMVMAGMPGSGASSVVSNLAESLAMSDRKVLIIDANFRRPIQHTTFGVADAPGLSDILNGDSTLEITAQNTSLPNLDVLAAGTARNRVVERLATITFAELLAEAASLYDIVLIDVPPAIVAGDGISVAHQCDASILVVKAYSEKRGLVSRIRNELTDARSEFLGVIVNGVRASAGGYLRGNIRASEEYIKKSA